MHILRPHVPWCYLPTSHRYSADVDSFDLLNFNSHNELMNYWSNDEAIVIQSQQRYLLQLEYVDRQIGRLIDRLEEAGLYDECLLIVTADHGVSFRAGQARRQATPETMADVLSVPLFVKRPGQAEGETSDLHAETIDVFPTITDVLGIQLRHPVDGRSVFDESQPDREQKFYSHLLTKVPVDVKVIVETDLPKMLRERFGDPRDPRALFRVGPVPELVGRRVDSLPLVAEPQGRLELVRYGDEASEGQDAYVPCFFEGYVRAPKVAEQPQLVAVAVNGVIGAVTRTYLLEEMKERWGTLVAEDLFHPGKNDVRFYLVTPAPGTGGWRLSPCEFRLIPEPPPF
jgi:hypothetical protein